MSTDIKQLEDKINNLANRIYKLNEPLDWNEIRTNVFPSQTAREKGMTGKKINDIITNQDWIILYWRMYNLVSRWEKKFYYAKEEESEYFDGDKQFKYTDVMLQAILYSLCKYNPNNGIFMHLFSKALKGYLINARKKETDYDPEYVKINIDNNIDNEENKPNYIITEETIFREHSKSNIDNPYFQDQFSVLVDKDEEKQKLNKLIKNVCKIHNKCNSNSHNKNVKETYLSYEILIYILKQIHYLNEDDIRQIITDSKFLSFSKEAIFHYYFDNQQKPTLKDYCKYLNISYNAVAQEKSRSTKKLE
ncbi:MAG: hypothetical protein IKQ61_05190 [Spirochaetales bacterium]|nr:hypothetical protein [Spirochaetales bacterium]